MTRTIMVLIPVLLASGLLLADSAPSRQETGFLNRHLTFSGKEYSYQVYVPADWTPAKRWPVILFLHGYGESGDDGLASTDVGIGSAIRMTPGRFPFVVVFPQCPWQHWWSDDDMARMALATLDAEVKEFNGDPDRLYLTGLSMGGYGSWYIASHYRGKFAAVALVCGGLRTLWNPNRNQDPEIYDQTARATGRTPVWIFHGGADDTVPVDESRRMFAALKNSGGVVRYYEYAEVGHNSWDNAYAEPDFSNWLLSHALSKEGKTTAQAEMKLVPAKPPVAQIDPKIYADYVGTYERERWPGTVIRQTLTLDGNTLRLEVRSDRMLKLLPISEQEFFPEPFNDSRYIFPRNANGQVDRMILRDKRHDEVFRKVNP